MSELEAAVEKAANLIRQRLRTEKAERDTGERYTEALRAAARYCKRRFMDSGSTAGGFTSHGPDHAARVLDYSLKIAGRLPAANRLCANEMYLLSLAATLHDLGMTAALPREVLKCCHSEHEQWVQRRVRHADATAEMLRACTDPDLQVVRAGNVELYNVHLPDICAAHSTSGFQTYEPDLRKRNEYHPDTRSLVIAGMLLLSDELDVCYKRAEPDRGRYSELQCNTSRAHWWKHWLVYNAHLEGNVFFIMHVNSTECPHADIFGEWTREKIVSQLAMLRRTLDLDGTSPLWRLVVDVAYMSPEPHGHITTEFPMTDGILSAAAIERQRCSQQRGMTVIRPMRLIQRIPNRDEYGNPSQFFRKAIAERIKLFRGQGRHVLPEKAAGLYVEYDANAETMANAIRALASHIRTRPSGVNLKVFLGQIGVGKTHFLSVCMHRLETQHPAEWSSAILARAELTRATNNIERLKCQVAKAVYVELANRNLVEPIRSAMMRLYGHAQPQVPATGSEIDAWNEESAESFIKAVGSVCCDSTIAHYLGAHPPTALCIFLDNSDHIKDFMVLELYSWCYRICDETGALLWLFLRPSSYALLQQQRENPLLSHISLRLPETIHAPSLKDVILKRVSKLPEEFRANETVVVQVDSSHAFSPTDVQESLTYIAGLALEGANGILPEMAKTPGSESDTYEPNIRAGLEGLVGILGSHIITDSLYLEALMLRQAMKQQNTKVPSERWARVLEALILGRRKWYSAECSPIENIFDPPSVGAKGDYFLILHCLQILVHQGPTSLAEVIRAASRLDYDEARVREAIVHLSTRVGITRDEDDFDYDTITLFQRSCPLVLVDGHQVGPPEPPYPEDATVAITPWGKCHLNILIYQAQYWRHVHYQIVLPGEMATSLMPQPVESELRKLDRNFKAVFEYLKLGERRRLQGMSAASGIGVKPVMGEIEQQVMQQIQHPW